jgi:DNA-binding CsgD family transcriptional regulator
VVESFQNAALGLGSWTDALNALAAATGSRGGELIGLGAEAAVPFNWFTEADPSAAPEFVEAGGGDPRINSRVRIGGSAPELTVLDERDFTSAEDGRRFPEYGEWMRRHDMRFACLSPLLRQDGLLVGLAVVRGEKQGNVSDEQKRAFAAVAPHVRAAVRTQMAMETQGLALLTHALDAIEAAAIVCDGSGLVRALSPLADRLLAEGRWLRLRGGRLAARHEADTAAMHEAFAAAAQAQDARRRPAQAFVVRDEGAVEPLLVEVATIPGEHAFRFGASVLLIARPPREVQSRAVALSRALFGLTAAEGLVAAQLVGGAGPQAIAERTGVSVGTVRTHIRRIFEKARVRSQLELVAALTSRL